MVNNKLAVCESFYSIQGEGSTMGVPAYFLRLAGCNLMCGGWGTEKTKMLHNGATWRCDSIEVWMKGKTKTFDQIIADLGDGEFIDNINGGAHLVITGGEPLLQQEAIVTFIRYLMQLLSCHYFHVEIETNGTIEPSDELMVVVDTFNVSLKLRNSGMTIEQRINADAIQKLHSHKGSIFKFVVSSQADIEEIGDVYTPAIDKKKMWLMPAADNAEDLITVSQLVAEFCKKYVINFSHRLHIAIWDKKTGV